MSRDKSTDVHDKETFRNGERFMNNWNYEKPDKLTGGKPHGKNRHNKMGQD